MQKLPPQLLKGFRDYLPPDALPLHELIQRIERVFRLYGFAPLLTPVLEYAALLTGKYGPEADKLMYTFVDHGGRTVAMRYDHTVPLARVIATNQNLPLPLKRYTIAPVWRADKPQRGRLREFYQCDVDIVGSDQTRADAEIIAVAHALFMALGIKEFSLRINHRRLISAVVEQVDGVSKTQVPAVIRVIDRLPKMGESAAIKYLAQQGLTESQVEQLLKLLAASGLHGPADKALGALRGFLKPNKDTEAALNEMDSIVRHAVALGVPKESLMLDLNVVRGLDYYTGLVVESVITNLPLYGSVFGGGRYDALIGQIAGKKVPAVGISLGLGRLFDALSELKLLPQVEPAARVVIALLDEGDSAAAQKAAQVLRTHDITTEVYLGRPTKIDKQLKFADKRGAAWVVWQGAKEKKKRLYAAKHLRTRTQVELPLDQLVEKIQQLA